MLSLLSVYRSELRVNPSQGQRAQQQLTGNSTTCWSCCSCCLLQHRCCAMWFGVRAGLLMPGVAETFFPGMKANVGSLYSRIAGPLRTHTAMPTNVALLPRAVLAEAGPAEPRPA